MSNERKYYVHEILPPDHTAEPPDEDGLILVRNEYGRPIVRVDNKALTMADWRRFVEHFTNVAVADGWTRSLRNLGTPEKAS